MKLAKLSLAAIVAVGAMTTVASAVDLEKAIKGTTLGGYIRYRHNVNYDNNNDKTLSTNEYKGVFNFKMPVNDMVKANIKFVTVGTTSDSSSKKTTDSNGDTTITDTSGDQNPTVNTKLANFIITPTKALTVVVGKQALVTPFADPADQAGTGIVGVMNLGKIKLYGGAYSNTNAKAGGLGNAKIGGADIYAAGVAADLGMVNGEFWYALVEPKGSEDNVPAMYVEANAKVSKVSLQVAHATVDYEDVGGKEQEQTRVVATAKIASLITATLGYVMTGDDGGNVVLGDTDAKANFGMEHLEAANVADATLLYVAGGMDFGKVGAKLEYIDGETGDTDLTEMKVSVGYTMSKNFKLSGWYSAAEIGDDDRTKARFEAKYKF